MTPFAPSVSVQLEPTAAAKLLQLLASPSHAPGKRGGQKTRRLSMRLLLRCRDGARLLPLQRCMDPPKAGWKAEKTAQGAQVETT